VNRVITALQSIYDGGFDARIIDADHIAHLCREILVDRGLAQLIIATGQRLELG